MAPVDAIVVGAGLSGLRAALDLQATGLSCMVLEAIDRVGGKTLSVQSQPNGPGVNDLGAAWINDTTQSEMYRLAREYGVHVEVQRAEGLSLMQVPGAVLAHPHGTLPLEGHDLELVGAAWQDFRDLIAKIDLEDPAATPGAKDLDNETVKDYCLRKFQSDVVLGTMDSVVQSLLGVESGLISVLSFLHSCKTAGGLDPIMSDCKDGGQYLRLREGMQTFSRTMATKLTPGSLFLSTPVTSIEQAPDQQVCTVRSGPSNQTFQAKKVILSVPTTLYHKIAFTPSLPEAKRRLASGNVMGYYSKMIFVFDQPWWQTAGLSGTIQTQDGPILFSRDTSIPSDKQWSITCFIVGSYGREWSLKSAQERQKMAWSQFRAVFEGTKSVTPGIKVPDPVNVLEKEWSKEEFFGGAPCPVPPPGLTTSMDGSAGRAPFDHIHFVGTETSVIWKGYMEGAVRSVARGAREVIDALGHERR